MTGFALTTKFNDGIAGDITTFEEDSGGLGGLYGRELASTTSLTAIVITCTADSSPVITAYVWNGTSYVTTGFTGPTPGPPAGGTPRTVTFTYSGTGPATADFLDYVILYRDTGEFMNQPQISDIRRT